MPTLKTIFRFIKSLFASGHNLGSSGPYDSSGPSDEFLKRYYSSLK